MSAKTGIEWTEATWNPVTGCSRVSPGCLNCYAEALSLRRGWSAAPWTAQNAERNVKLHPERLRAPLGWRRPRRVFVNSMSDLFHELVPEAFLDQVFAVMALSARHTYQVLTKRPERMREYMLGLADRGGSGRGFARLEAAASGLGWTLEFEGRPLLSWPIPNVWLGVSCEDQRRADERIGPLLATPAALRFLSCEPLLEAVSLRWPSWHNYSINPHATLNEYDGLKRLDWVIVGGESGPGARPMLEAWPLQLQRECKAAGVPFFFKQWGGAGNKRGHAQALLGGQRYAEYPAART